ncbi:glycosyltransferase family 2 protein [Ottowia sp.]|uniref:glycosyltransferase family 2 protein n=1 Tax=Ottowia sp. TaxID=1898956 RepID=UPI003A898065
MDITVSVVSHGHGADVDELLLRLADLKQGVPRRVIVTRNVPEPDKRGAAGLVDWPFDLVWIDNDRPIGFGANHNRAFARDGQLGASALFAVLNPDIRWQQSPFRPMQEESAGAPQAGLIYPVQLGTDGRRQDHERLVPTPARLWARYRPGGQRQEVAEGEQPDWVNGAFMLLRRQAFADIQGFDEAYYMYGEDVDLCLRLQLAGWQIKRCNGAVVEHTGRRASRRDLRHFGWHVGSLWRLWRSSVWRAWRQRQQKTSRSAHMPRP